MLSADCVQAANSGHPGMPMGAAPMAYVLWTKFLRHNPRNPNWPNRDRFVLSAGHGSMLLYSLLYLTGYDLTLEDLKNFRQWGSKTPGHPEFRVTPGVETTTGPLGQGFANGVGMAMAERFLAARFNRPGHQIVDHYTYAIVSDGDLMEGISHESASLAGHLRLGRLIYLYDDNHISIEGNTDITFTEDRAARFQAYGWHVEVVEDGNDLEAIEEAIQRAKDETERPSIIAIRTHIGYGSPGKQDDPSAHGEPLGEEELARTKENLGWPTEPMFYVPSQALEHLRKAIETGEKLEAQWNKSFERFRANYPKLAQEFEAWMKGVLPDGWADEIPAFVANTKGMATRAASGLILNQIASKVKNLIGGSADLAPSNKTLIKGGKDFQAPSYEGRNIRFGVREHAMGAILNGMALHGGIIPYGGTFLVFSDYMKPAIRLAALMGLKVIYIFTHDSIGLGEDGPTHQPIEQLASLRAIPNLTVLRPADANETAEAWKTALQIQNAPVALVLTRQVVPVLDRNHFPPAHQLQNGAYVLAAWDEEKPDLILIATGSEVHIALEAAQQLKGKGIKVRVVNIPSWELFDQQSQAYKEEVLPSSVWRRIVIEAGCGFGWHKYAGDKGRIIAVERFGASAPYKVLYQEFGLTKDRIVEEAFSLLAD